MHTDWIPINRADDGELLGFIAQRRGSWEALTVFGYVIARVEEQSKADDVVRTQGLLALTGVWQYFDSEDNQWHPCIIKEAAPLSVTVIRTNEMGYQDANKYKLVVLKKPDETMLIKA